MEYLQELISNKEEKDRSRWVILILFLLIFLFSILLYRNLTRRGKEGDNPVIGVLTFKNRIVERKLDSEVIWDKVDSGVEIRNKDTIRSADFSDALLTLKDTTKIGMSENSMIYLDLSDGMNLDFAYGSLSLEGGGSTPITVTSNDKVIELENSSIKIEKQGKEDFKLEVKEGQAKVKVGNEEKDVKKNEIAKVEEKKVIIEDAVIQLESPAEVFSVSTKTNSASVSFAWKVNSVVQKTSLEFSYDSRFRKILKSVPVNSNSIALDLNSGVYYWRISGEHSQKKQKESSSFRRLQIIAMKSPKILSPKENQNFSYVNNAPVINFSWTSVDSVKFYKLELSQSNDFSNPIKTIQTTQNYVGIDNLKAGQYFARLITEFNISGENPELSKTLSFSLTEKKDPDPPAHLSTSTQDQVFDKNVLQKKGYNLVWKDSPEFVQYDLQVAEDTNFQNTIISEKTPHNHKKVNFAAKPGTYYWRVAGITKDGKKTDFSKTARIQIKSTETVQLISPASRASFDSSQKEISFRWKKVDTTPNFKWELSNSANFANIIKTENIKGYIFNISNLNSGNYFWRVTLLDEEGTSMATSSINEFSIRDLDPPTPVFPVMGQRVDMSNLDALNFQWKADKAYSSFLFELYSGKNNQMIAKTQTPNRKYVFKDLSKLDEGDFYWTLKGFLTNDEETEIVGGKIRFSIYLSENPKPPKIKTPKKIYMD